METQKLRDASEHLLYEVTMFDATAHRLAAGMPDGVEENAFLESFAIHTRALLQFFIPTDPRENDVLAWHYFGDKATWARLRGKTPRALEKVNDRVGKEIVHLTYGRLGVLPEAKDWGRGRDPCCNLGAVWERSSGTHRQQRWRRHS